MAALLDVRGLTHTFGGLRAVDDLSFQVHEGHIASLIGPNGAGKTTVFNCITGLYRPQGGSILFRPVRRLPTDDSPGLPRELRGLRPHRIASLGLVRTFQSIRLFPNMNALDNVLAGRHCRTHAGVVGAILRPPRQRREEHESAAAAMSLLAFVDLADRRESLAGALAYGEQRRLEIARALATEPSLLVLDEPAAGMNPVEKERLAALIYRIRDRGVTVLLIEHDMRLVMGVSDHVTVLDYGRKIAAGPPQEVQRDPAVIEAYLGVDDEALSLLQIENLSVRYGAIQAVRNISLQVESGEVVALLGSNGAGKTTTLRAIAGLVRPSAGRISFAGTDLRTLPPYAIVGRGLAHCPEGRRIFATMTVEENLDLGAYMHRGRGLAPILEAGKRRAFHLFPVLGQRRSQLAGTLSGGEQQMLAIARALMARPVLLTMDEPSMGLSPLVAKTIFRTIREISAEGVTVLLVEQNARAALRLASRGYVLETGRIVLEGSAATLLADTQLQASYLGTS